LVTTVHTIETAVERGAPASLSARLSMLVLDVSARGCLLESRAPLEPGQIATLRLALGGVWYVEDVRVTRAVAVPGRGATYHIGLEFLRTHGPQEQSLRTAIGQLISASLADTEPSGPRPGSAHDRRA